MTGLALSAFEGSVSHRGEEPLLVRGMGVVAGHAVQPRARVAEVLRPEVLGVHVVALAAEVAHGLGEEAYLRTLVRKVAGRAFSVAGRGVGDIVTDALVEVLVTAGAEQGRRCLQQGRRARLVRIMAGNALPLREGLVLADRIAGVEVVALAAELAGRFGQQRSVGRRVGGVTHQALTVGEGRMLGHGLRVRPESRVAARAECGRGLAQQRRIRRAVRVVALGALSFAHRSVLGGQRQPLFGTRVALAAEIELRALDQSRLVGRMR